MQNEQAYNKIEIPEGLFEDMEEGSELNDVTISGRLAMKSDGGRCIEVTAVDGTPIENEEKEETPEEMQEGIKSARKKMTNGISEKYGKNMFT